MINDVSTKDGHYRISHSWSPTNAAPHGGDVNDTSIVPTRSASLLYDTVPPSIQTYRRTRKIPSVPGGFDVLTQKLLVDIVSDLPGTTPCVHAAGLLVVNREPGW